VDNLDNSKEESLKRVEEITGKSLTFYKTDLLNKPALDDIFSRHKIDSVVHFAGYKAVGESVSKPLSYYHNNITGTLYLCEVMEKYSVTNIVFSSSATVYGNPHEVPIQEDFPLQTRSEEHTSELQSRFDLVCRLLLEKKKQNDIWVSLT